MRTAAWEAAPHVALRDCSKDCSGRCSLYRFWWRGSSVPLRTHFTEGFLLVRRIWCHHERIQCFSIFEEMQGLGSWSQFLKIPELSEDLLHQFPWSTECLTLHPERPSGGVEGRQLPQLRVQPPETDQECPCCYSLAGRYSWQVPGCSWHVCTCCFYFCITWAHLLWC